MLLHIIGLLYFFKYHKNGWATLSVIAVIFSTSITAYAVLILIFSLYLLYTKKYLSIASYTLILTIVAVAMYLRYDYLMSISISSHNEYETLSSIDMLLLNISGYFTNGSQNLLHQSLLTQDRFLNLLFF